MTKQKVYGIDLDGVCFNFKKGFLAYVNARFHLDIDADSIKSYWWYEDKNPLTKEMFFQAFHEFGKTHGYATLEVFPGVLDALRALHESGAKIHYVTNRPAYAFNDTKEIMKSKDFPQRENLHFADGDKSPIIRELAIDTFIDDSPHTLEQIVAGTRADVYCVSYSFNTHLDDTFMTRVDSLSQMAEIELAMGV